MEDWHQLREAGLPVDRVWKQGMPLDISGEEVNEQSQASEMETPKGCSSELTS